jgi:peptidyl-prolyl cis-trans isomerase C
MTKRFSSCGLLCATVATFLCSAAALAANNQPSLFDKPSPRTLSLLDDRVVAHGKDFQIKQSQIDEMYLAFKGHRAAMGQAIPDEMRPRIEADILDKLIATKLFLQRATAEDKAKAKEIADSFLADQRKQVPSEESFRRQLLAVGMTPAEFDTQIREQAVVKAVIDREIKAHKKISDAEVKKFYVDNPNLFMEPETVRASHILIATRDTVSGKPFTPELKLEKKRLAEKLVGRARAEEDFAKLVREFSEDPRSKNRGGEYTFTRAKDNPNGAMVPEFEAAAFSMSTNQVSDVVETSYGYHVIKLLEKTPANKIEFGKVEARIRDTLLRDAVERELPVYLEKMKKEASVQVLLSANSSAAGNPE